jgi:hypothetical protein
VNGGYKMIPLLIDETVIFNSTIIYIGIPLGFLFGWIASWGINTLLPKYLKRRAA